MKIHKCNQGSDVWFATRLGKFTGSKASAIGNNGRGLDTLVFEKAKELATGKRKEVYQNDAMKRGTELEPKARIAYEFETGNVVKEVGFIERDEYSGCSPDGLIGDDGGVEIKCPVFRTFYEYAQTGKVKTGYMWQIQMSLLVSERSWWDYAVFHPAFKEPLIIKRIERDEKKIEKLRIGLENGIKKLNKIMEVVK